MQSIAFQARQYCTFPSANCEGSNLFSLMNLSHFETQCSRRGHLWTVNTVMQHVQMQNTYCFNCTNTQIQFATSVAGAMTVIDNDFVYVCYRHHKTGSMLSQRANQHMLNAQAGKLPRNALLVVNNAQVVMQQAQLVFITTCMQPSASL